MMSRSALWGQAPEVCFWPASGWSVLGPVSKACSLLGGQATRIMCPLHLGGGSKSEKACGPVGHPTTFREERGLSL